MGAIDALAEGDALYASYRDHGTALAVGSPAAAVMAELFGKETGVAHGRGGSMHLLDVERHFYGGWGIVGAHLPIAAGTALAIDYREQPNAVLCQFGDGAVATGAFHEALNLAARLGPSDRLPGRSTTSTAWAPRSSSRTPSPSCGSGRPPTACTASRSTATTCWRCARRPTGCLRQAREERRPALLETVTYRFRGHSVADAGKVYRTRRGDRVVARARPDHPLRPAAAASAGSPAPTRPRRDLAGRGRRGQGRDRRGAGGRRARPRQPLRAPLRRPGLARSSSRACGAGAPFGERGEEQTWPT